jgi:hypothetical protein
MFSQHSAVGNEKWGSIASQAKEVTFGIGLRCIDEFCNFARAQIGK